MIDEALIMAAELCWLPVWLPRRLTWYETRALFGYLLMAGVTTRESSNAIPVQTYVCLVQTESKDWKVLIWLLLK